jgi:WD40 repeat protein
VRVWSLPKGQLLNTLRLPIGAGNEGQVYAVAVSPDGTTVAAGGWTGYEWDQSDSIYLFDRSSGQLVRRLTGLPDAILDLAYSRDGRYLAAGLVGKNGIRIYRTDDWQLVAEDRDYGDASPSVDFAADGRLMSTSHDGFIRLYGPDFRLLLKKIAPGGRQPFDARFSPDGTRIAVGFDDTPSVNVLSAQGLQLLYAPHTGILVPMVSWLMRRLGSGGSADLRSVAWSQDGRFLYASGRCVNPNLLRIFAGALGLYPELDMIILRWRDGGRGSPEYLPASYNTITDLHALADGKLAYAASDPAFGVFAQRGTRSCTSHRLLPTSGVIPQVSCSPTTGALYSLVSSMGAGVQRTFRSTGAY